MTNEEFEAPPCPSDTDDVSCDEQIREWVDEPGVISSEVWDKLTGERRNHDK